MPPSWHTSSARPADGERKRRWSTRRWLRGKPSPRSHGRTPSTITSLLCLLWTAATLTIHPRRRDLLVVLGETQWRIGQVERAKEALREAAAIAREVGTAEELGRVALAFGGPFVNYSTVDDPELIGLLEDALVRPGLEEGPLRARLSARLAEALSFAGGTRRRVKLARQALALARRLADPATLFFVLASCHWALGDPDSLDERLAMTAEAIDLAEELNDRVSALEARFWHLSDLLESGDLDGARAQQAEAFSLAQELRQPYPLWLLSASAGLLALLEGRYGDAERLAGESMSYGLAAQNPNAVLVPSAMLFVVLRDRGRLAELEAAVTGFVDEFPVMAALRCGLTLLLAELGRLDEARLRFEELARRGFADIPRDATWFLSVAMLTETCAILGDKPRAALLYDLLYPYSERWATVVDTSFGSVARLLGLLATTLGRHDEAERCFDAATAIHTRSATSPWLARTHADRAAGLIQRGRRPDRGRAAGLITQARAIATDLGMDQLLQRLDTLETQLY
jgi:tetratricopeptide (TPR) repeat protein